MAKLHRGRLNGLNGMTSFTSKELFSIAEEMEVEMTLSTFTDDPKWQLRRIEKVRKLAEKKEKALEHKNGQ